MLDTVLIDIMRIFPKEYIKDEDRLHRRIHPDFFKEKIGRASSAAFRDPKTSVNWEKYSTPQDSVKKYPTHYVASIVAQIPRRNNLGVEHYPSISNRAHSLIIGRRNIKIARLLALNSVITHTPLSITKK